MKLTARIAVTIAALALVATIVPIRALAAADAFLNIDGIQGESQDDNFKGQIEVLSVTQPAPTTRAAAGKVNEFVITKVVDKASPLLLKHCAKGTHFDKVLLSVRKAGGAHVEYLTYTLHDAVIASISPVAGSNPPQETLTLTYASMTESTPTAAVTAGPAAAVGH